MKYALSLSKLTTKEMIEKVRFYHMKRKYIFFSHIYEPSDTTLLNTQTSSTKSRPESRNAAWLSIFFGDTNFPPQCNLCPSRLYGRSETVLSTKNNLIYSADSITLDRAMAASLIRRDLPRSPHSVERSVNGGISTH